MALPHVLLFPLPLQGHINPFLWLADYLASSDISVTFVFSAHSFALFSRNSASRLALLDSTSNPRVEIVPDGLAADDNKSISRSQLLASYPVMEKGFDQLLQKLSQENRQTPSCIIVDSFMPGIRNVADKPGIPCIEFWTCSATVYAMMSFMPELAKKGYLPLQQGSEMEMVDFISGVAPFPISAFPKGFAADDAMSPRFQYFCSVFAHNREVNRILVYSVYDLERAVIDALRHQSIPIEPIGPFISAKSLSVGSVSLFPEDDSCLNWLDAQPEASVLYVSFGSLATVDKRTFEELAFGLESSQVRFLWVIRPDAAKGVLDELLPQGFQSRTGGKGRIISWAPQLAVLGHPAVGSFLTHCGWNSTMESLYMGVPMIGLPLEAEQNTNLKCIIDWKVGMALSDGQGLDSSKCSREAVEQVVRAMMEGEEGSEARKRARELRQAATKAIGQHGSSKVALERLVEDLKCGKLKAGAAAFPISASCTANHENDRN